MKTYILAHGRYKQWSLPSLSLDSLLNILDLQAQLNQYLPPNHLCQESFETLGKVAPKWYHSHKTFLNFCSHEGSVLSS